MVLKILAFLYGFLLYSLGTKALNITKKCTHAEQVPMSQKCAVSNFKCVLSYFKRKHRFFWVTYLPDYAKYWQKNSKIMKNQFNSPEIAEA